MNVSAADSEIRRQKCRRKKTTARDASSSDEDENLSDEEVEFDDGDMKMDLDDDDDDDDEGQSAGFNEEDVQFSDCLLYTSPSPRDS